jgi:hypothetical protein
MLHRICASIVCLVLLLGCGGSDDENSPDNPTDNTDDSEAPTLSIATNVVAECRYATSTDTAFEAMVDKLETTDGTTHSATLNNLADDATYHYYIRCQDEAGNANQIDYSIIFMVGAANAGLDAQVIAYVGSSTTNQEIHLIHPDGTQDTTIWRVPEGTDPSFGIGMVGLSWRPDGGEIAFDSAHNWDRSIDIRDLYAITPDGQSYRRITHAPDPTAYDQLPQGEVTFVLSMYDQGDMQVYIEGMPEPYDYFARTGEDWTFTLPVADFGDNHRQYIPVFDFEPSVVLHTN